MSSFVHIHYFSLLQVSLELRQHQTHLVRPPTIRLVKLLEQEVSLESSIQTSYLVILICFHGQFNSSSNFISTFSATASTTGFGGSGGLFSSGGGNQTTSLFGGGNQQQQQQQNSSFSFGGGATTGGTNTFGASTNFGGSSFGSTVVAQDGTGHTKFQPTTSTDTMMKSGQSTQISTRHQCITCMKEYENKSLEELRCEDYIAGRKSGGAAGAIGGGMFGQAAPTTGTGLFGQQQTTSSSSGGESGVWSSLSDSAGSNRRISLQDCLDSSRVLLCLGPAALEPPPPPAPPQTSEASDSQHSRGQVGKICRKMGRSNVTFISGFNQAKPTAFGQPQPQASAAPAFGATGGFGTNTTGGLFGQTSQPSAFGSTFGQSSLTTNQQQPTNQIGLFGSTAAQKPAFGATTTTQPAGGGMFGSTAQTGGLFGATQQKPAFGFGQPTSSAPPAFGASTGFGTNTSQAGGPSSPLSISVTC